MKCHLPVLAAAVGALPEVAGDAAVYVDPENTNEIASALRRLCLDPDLRAQLASKAANRADLFDWATAAKHTLTALESAAANNS